MERVCGKKPLGLLSITPEGIRRGEYLSKVKMLVEDPLRKLAQT